MLVSFVSFRNFHIIEESLAALVNVHDRQLARNLTYLENNLLNQKLLWLIKHIQSNLSSLVYLLEQKSIKNNEHFAIFYCINSQFLMKSKEKL